jgi:hypothetical protein
MGEEAPVMNEKIAAVIDSFDEEENRRKREENARQLLERVTGLTLPSTPNDCFATLEPWYEHNG